MSPLVLSIWLRRFTETLTHVETTMKNLEKVMEKRRKVLYPGCVSGLTLHPATGNRIIVPPSLMLRRHGRPALYTRQNRSQQRTVSAARPLAFPEMTNGGNGSMLPNSSLRIKKN
ncbi:hypothetical protein TNCT_546621 [Trichonephila clavata]|uniref:Uncharacterized protein n=1 Tax=Trichonephila clavata TaxID=2740835 RepID=A0A8X6GE56_TRICU|nr:hypothetical protein TNCT_546621 [Trichonephila clavata]